MSCMHGVQVTSSPQVTLVLIAEAYLGPYETTMMEPFCKNGQWLKAINYFHKKAPS